MVKRLSSQLFQARVNKIFLKRANSKNFQLSRLYYVTSIQLFLFFFIGSMKAAIDNMLMNGHGCVSVKVYLQK